MQRFSLHRPLSIFLASLFSLGPMVSLVPAQGLTPLRRTGFYTDKPGYTDQETITIHANWGERDVTYRLLRAGPRVTHPDQWDLVATTPTYTYGAAVDPPYGSFVEFPLELDGASPWTIAGWVQPSQAGVVSGGDTVCLAGEMFLNDSLLPAGEAGIGISADGALFAMARSSNQSQMVLAEDLDTARLQTGEWAFVAATWDSNTLRLFAGDDETCAVLVASSAVDAHAYGTGTPGGFRLGARAEAPGDRAGCFSGRVDLWGAWAGAMQLNMIRRFQELGGTSGCPTSANLPPSEWMVTFDQLSSADYAQGLVRDESGNDGHGTIRNHGAPGLSGRPIDTPGLRLHHDQVIDAQFPTTAMYDGAQVPVQIDLSALNLTSGMYALQAIVRGVDPPGSTQPIDRLVERFTSFAIRPSTPSGAELAVILPVNTWMSYNPWPGARPNDAGLRTAPGLTPRYDDQGIEITQGNNAHYGLMGDGTSENPYSGWLRPNPLASPLKTTGPSGFFINDATAWMDSQVFQWLENPAQLTDALPYDVYTDWDLDAGILDVSDYKVIAIIGHSEYWSQEMLDQAVACPGFNTSILCLSGNTMAWRCKLLDHQGGRVSEIRRWPVDPQQGCQDSLSAVGGDQMGFWRFINQTRDVNQGGPNLDEFVIGTLQDLPGGLKVEEFGYWKPVLDGHWLWGDLSGTALEDALTGVGRVVGYEADGYVCPSDEFFCEQLGYPDGPSTIPASFPFSYSGQVAVLASGTDFGGGSLDAFSQVINWCSNAYDATDPRLLDCLDDQGGAVGSCPDCSAGDLADAQLPINTITDLVDGHGDIVYYEYDQEGDYGVLNIASQYSGVAVNTVIPSGRNPIAELAERVLDHWLMGPDTSRTALFTVCEDR